VGVWARTTSFKLLAPTQQQHALLKAGKVLVMKRIILFLSYYCLFRLRVLLRFHHTSRPLNMRWRWRNWNWQQR
jgi:hypothetical protein